MAPLDLRLHHRVELPMDSELLFVTLDGWPCMSLQKDYYEVAYLNREGLVVTPCGPGVIPCPQPTTVPWSAFGGALVLVLFVLLMFQKDDRSK